MSELVEVGTPMPGRASPWEPGPVAPWWMGPGEEDDEEAPIGDPDDDEGYGEDDEDDEDEDEEPLQL